MSEVTVRVPAKVNLGLSVGPAGDDGYHELVNVFHAVSLFDEVTARPGEGFSVTVQQGATPGPCGHEPDVRATRIPPSGRADTASLTEVPAGDDNLAVRAARLLAEHAGSAGGVELHIRKSIPVAGGMAGGSADAAAALVACDAVWKTGLAQQELLRLAARLGADVAFPLAGGTAVGVGRGERLTPLSLATTLYWVFALAEGGLSTAAVYAECDRLRAEAGEPVPQPRESPPLMAALEADDPVAVGDALYNDLQPAALTLRPDLGQTLRAGTDSGTLAALVSGSGPTCAFLARSEEHAAELAGALERAGVCRETRQAYGPVPGARIVSRTE